MKIEVLATDGSPLGVTEQTIWGNDPMRIGCGGAELAILTLCAEWTDLGHEVTFYNNPIVPNGSRFEQRPINAFDPSGSRDILIVLRSPNPRAINATGLKVWFSMDQYTVGDFRAFAPLMDKIVVISEFHQKHFKEAYGIDNTIAIDIPVRIHDYDSYDCQRIPNRLLFSSVPDRGLENVWRMWNAITRRVPEAHVVITSDYRLWGSGENIQHYRTKWIVKNSYTYMGALKRDKFLEEQLKADILFYPGHYDELFCIAAAEAQVAGAYPLTSNTGALETTNMGTVIRANPQDPRNDITYVDALCELLEDREKLEKLRKKVQKRAIERFSPERILKEWEEKVFGEDKCDN